MQWLSKLVLLGLLFIYGCGKPGQVEFVQVVQDHSRLTQVTNDAVIATIQDELNDAIANGDVNESDKKSIEDLITRLKLVSQQADVINQYVNATEVDEEMLSKLLRSRWTQN